jgi:hypothetical protein
MENQVKCPSEPHYDPKHWNERTNTCTLCGNGTCSRAQDRHWGNKIGVRGYRTACTNCYEGKATQHVPYFFKQDCLVKSSNEVQNDQPSKEQVDKALLDQISTLLSSIPEDKVKEFVAKFNSPPAPVATTQKTEKITVNGTHTGYLRKDGRSIIYERRDDVEKQLARYNYTIPHEKKEGKKSLKSDMFFSSKSYGEAISKAWNLLEANKNSTVKENQKAIDEIFSQVKL